jgi:hypothetical protein
MKMPSELVSTTGISRIPGDKRLALRVKVEEGNLTRL